MAGFSRRAALLGAVAAAACARSTVYTQASETSLAELAAAKGIDYGSMVTWKSWDGNNAINREDAFAQLVQRECAIIVSAMEMFWNLNSDGPGQTGFSGADAIAAWAQAHGKKLRGHNLIWHAQTPDWFKGIDDAAKGRQRMIDHVTEVCGRYAGRMHSWDVVNEVIDPTDGEANGLRKSKFLDLLGPGYLDDAFHAARAADPKALLVMNDFNLEYDIDSNEEKRRALIALLDGFKQRGTPIDAVGLQSHLWVARRGDLNQKVLQGFFQEIADRGLQVMLTELDVVDVGAPADIPARDAEVAATYKEYLDVALGSPAVKTVITWGLCDRDSWITHYNLKSFRRDDGKSPRPLPFDSDLKPKPAYFAMAEAFKAAAPR